MVVVGGGNVAVDVARTAARYGADKVTMLCLEQRDEMPAADDEVLEAEEENIVVECGWGPKEFVVENGKVKAVVFKKCVSVFDADHRFSPKYDENDTMTLDADYVLAAIGQSIQWGGLLDGTKVKTNRNGTAQADEWTYQTAEPDVFVGGDVYTGPNFAIRAIAAGKEGADSEPEKIKTFSDERLAFTEEQVKAETARCLSCGAARVDDKICIGCGICTTRCKFDAIHLTREKDAWGTTYETLVPFVLKGMGNRVADLAKKKLTPEFKK